MVSWEEEQIKEYSYPSNPSFKDVGMRFRFKEWRRVWVAKQSWLRCEPITDPASLDSRVHFSVVS